VKRVSLFALQPSKPTDADSAASRSAKDQSERKTTARLYCAHCRSLISDRDQIFFPRAETPLIFANPAGHVFELLTVRAAVGLIVLGDPTLQATWFPGYAWRVVLCACCMNHLGWHYEATTSGCDPSHFYGLLRAALVELEE
jgi:cereblon